MEPSTPSAGSQLAPTAARQSASYRAEARRVSSRDPLAEMAAASQGNLELANHTGYIKVDGQRVEKDMKKAKEQLKIHKSNQIPTEVKSKLEEVVSFVKKNVLVTGGFFRGFLLGPRGWDPKQHTGQLETAFSSPSNCFHVTSLGEEFPLLSSNDFNSGESGLYVFVSDPAGLLFPKAIQYNLSMIYITSLDLFFHILRPAYCHAAMGIPTSSVTSWLSEQTEESSLFLEIWVGTPYVYTYGGVSPVIMSSVVYLMRRNKALSLPPYGNSNSKDPTYGIKKLGSEDLKHKCGQLGFGSGNNDTILIPTYLGRKYVFGTKLTTSLQLVCSVYNCASAKCETRGYEDLPRLRESSISRYFSVWRETNKKASCFRGEDKKQQTEEGSQGVREVRSPYKATWGPRPTVESLEERMVQQLATCWQGQTGGKKSDKDTETVVPIQENKLLHPSRGNGKERKQSV
ncbi:hypothetical protein EI555_007250 [Monodon monoceros]|uniref:FUN14 domain-containing protein 2 n=1 Tax=Monodon monoceros TaxID=40151 RepID=A0A4U1ERW2_MONMO|nr:hypothetical protein EI555_007250 [Monodon monoceros]